MEITIIDGLRAVRLDLVLTLALAAIFLFIGYGIQRRVGVLARYSIPAAAIGGLLFAFIVFVLRWRGLIGFALDGSLRAPLQTAFFTTIGLNATLRLLRMGGWRMVLFWLLASVAAVIQTVAGIGVARAIGAPPLLGVICGALTLSGGPATGLAWKDTFEALGVSGAGTAIIASATFGIFVSSLVGNPVATFLISRFRLAPRHETGIDSPEPPPEPQPDPGGEAAVPVGVWAERYRVVSEELNGYVLLRNLAIILGVMGAGALISQGLAQTGITLPGYVGAMVAAAVARNLDWRLGWLRIEERAVEALGTIALALFLVLALMDLKLWQLAGLARPMVAILGVQVVVTTVYAALVVFTLMGRNYEAAVTSSGYVGFGLGITPNAVANMEALVERYGPAPRSFLIVPIVGAFFIDFSNTIIITFFVNAIK